VLFNSFDGNTEIRAVIKTFHTTYTVFRVFDLHGAITLLIEIAAWNENVTFADIKAITAFLAGLKIQLNYKFFFFSFFTV
jgi:hypothetical protein